MLQQTRRSRPIGITIISIILLIFGILGIIARHRIVVGFFWNARHHHLDPGHPGSYCCLGFVDATNMGILGCCRC